MAETRTRSVIGTDLADTESQIQQLVDKYTVDGRLTTPSVEDDEKLTQLTTKKTSLEAELKEAEARVNRLTETAKSVAARSEQRMGQPGVVSDGKKDPIVYAQPKVRYGLRAFLDENGKEDPKSALIAGKFIAGLTTRNMDKREEARTYVKEQAGIEYRVIDPNNEGVNTDGGYLVPTLWDNAVVVLREQYGIARRKSSMKQMGSNKEKFDIWTGDNTASWEDEQQTFPNSKLAFGQGELNAHKLTSLNYVSSELNEDAIISMADFVAQSMARQFSLKEDFAAFIGDGSATYGNILGIIPKFNSISNAAGIYTPASANSWSALTKTDITALMGTLPQFSPMMPEFYCSRQFYYNVMVPLLTGGNNTISDLQYADLQAQLWMGHKVNFVQGDKNGAIMPIATATSTIHLLFGWMDLATKFGERKGITITVHDQTTEAVEKDLIVIKGRERVDFNPHSLGDATFPGALVALKTHS